MSRREFCPVAACVADHGPPALPPVPAPARHARRAEPPSAGPGKLSCPACPALRQQTVDVDFAGGEITTNGGTQLVHMATERLRVIERLEAGRADCEPLAGKSTLNRLELAAAGTDARKARKIGVDFQQLDGLLLDLYLERHQRPPRKIVLDIDATDVPLYGEQEERFYHGYYKEYCYMPVLFLAGRRPLMVRLRSAAHDAAAGLERDLEWLLERLRKAWPRTRIIVRTDAGFCREQIMALCEGQERVDYVLGLGSNARLRAELAEEMQAAREERERTQQAARRFKDFQYRTRESWSRPRRVVGKAEALPEQGVQAGEGQPALRGDNAAGEVLRGAQPVRELLLRTGERGEPGEGAQGASVLEALLEQPVRREHAARLHGDVRAAGVPRAAQGAAGHAAEAGSAAEGAAGPAAGGGARAGAGRGGWPCRSRRRSPSGRPLSGHGAGCCRQRASQPRARRWLRRRQPPGGTCRPDCAR